MAKYYCFVLIFLTSITLSLQAVETKEGSSIIPIEVPSYAVSPNVQVDQDGGVHLVYLKDKGQKYFFKSIFYRYKSSPRDDWSSPVKVNKKESVQQPTIALGKKKEVFVAWSVPNAEIRGAAQKTRKSKFREVKLSKKPKNFKKGALGPRAASGPDGTIYVVWIDRRNEKVRGDGELRMNISKDGGRTFLKKSKKINKDAICTCCAPNIEVGADGTAYVSFRSSKEDVKDMSVIRTADRGETFQEIKVGNDNWKIRCPESSPILKIDSSGKYITVTWRAKGKFNFAYSTDSGETYTNASFEEFVKVKKPTIFIADKEGTLMRVHRDGSAFKLEGEEELWGWGSHTLGMKMTGILDIIVRNDSMYYIVQQRKKG